MLIHDPALRTGLMLNAHFGAYEKIPTLFVKHHKLNIYYGFNNYEQSTKILIIKVLSTLIPQQK